MWRCPKCETLNEADVCMVCGEKEPPVIKLQPLPMPKPVVHKKRIVYDNLFRNVGRFDGGARVSRPPEPASAKLKKVAKSGLFSGIDENDEELMEMKRKEDKKKGFSKLFK